MSIKSPLGRQFGTQFDSVFDTIKSNRLYDKVGQIPKLDLHFSKNESLVDSRSLVDKISFTRSTVGTYYDKNGILKTSALNHAINSNDFSGWTTSNTTVTSNAGDDPRGTSFSNIITSSASNGYIAKSDVMKNLDQSTQYVISLFIKNISATAVSIQARNGSSSTLFSSSPIDINVFGQLITNKWVRVSGTFTPDAGSGDGEVRILTDDEIQIYGLQVEEGATPTTYIPTGAQVCGAPRFEYDVTTNESLGLLLEDASSNSIRHSQKLNSDTTDWAVQNNATSSLSSITAPDGISKMWLVDLSSTPGNSSIGSRIFQSANTYNTSDKYYFSFWARSVSGSGTFPAAYFIQGVNYNKVYISLDETIRRYSVEIPATVNGNIVAFSRRGTDHLETLTQAYIWGTQLEKYNVSSYIKTESSAVTRSADVVEITGSNFNTWYNEPEGTILCHSAPSGPSVGSSTVAARSFLVSNGSTDEMVGTSLNSTSTNNLFIKTPLAAEASLADNIPGLPKELRHAIAYKAGDHRGAYDGQLGLASNLNDVAEVDQIGIGCQNFTSAQFLNGHIYQLSYFSTRLVDFKLTSITTS